MNYFITHCDKKYIKYAERLFKSLERYSNCKVLFFSVDFDYKNRFKNVINVKFNTAEAFGAEENDFTGSFDENCKSFHVFIKPLLIKNILEGKLLKISDEDNFCYLDSDCFARKYCDNIFLNAERIVSHPLLNVACQEFMMMSDGRGNPFANGDMDLNLSLEAPLMHKLGININLRTNTYLQTGVFLFNIKCYNFLLEWFNLCFSDLIINGWQHFAPFHEETVINCLLWRDKVKDNLKQTLINVIEGGQNELQLMVDKLKNPKPQLERLTTFCVVPAKQDIDNLYFYHRRVTNSVYKFLTKEMKQYYLLVHSPSLGDTLAATPTLRKISKSYDSLINVVTYNKEIFKNNKYVSKLYSFEEYNSLKSSVKGSHEVFETFLGIGDKNERGIEKKHATIDIRQFHALDLGFCLSDKEMEYDFFADEYQPIQGLPENYIVLHVGSTWPSRTYSKENWQQLIKLLNQSQIPVVLVGKNDHETGFYDIDKKTINLNINLGLDLTNQLTLSQCWHVINKSNCLITMDSGLLHIAGTTDTFIVQLGSSLNNKLRAPYRNGSQDYKYKYISGPCDIFCASDIKYGIKEWGTIQGVPPLINCLEGKDSFECHPDPVKVHQFVEKKYNTNNTTLKKKILFLAPHLSTGGSPAYLKWLIEKRINEGHEVAVVEYCYYGNYVVQRNQIEKTVGPQCFYSFGRLNDSDESYQKRTVELIKHINLFNPDEIHLNEIAEVFSLKVLTDELKEFLYSPDRKFKIFETCHNSTFDFNNKVLIPDEFHFCSPFHLKLSEHLNIPKKIVEMEIPKKQRPERTAALNKLGLSPDYFHVLNVGLFMVNKNQKYLFTLAEKLKDRKIKFHFIGNTCFLNDCGIPENLLSLDSCVIHGEKDNVDEYMAAMDLFAFPSLLELNPISLKEALSWGMKTFLNKLDVYSDYFDDNDLVTYIKNDNLYKYLESMTKLTSDIHSEDNNKITHSFENTIGKVEILGSDNFNYLVKFFNSEGQVSFKDKITNNMWSKGLVGACGRVEITNLSNFKKTTLYFENKKDSDINIINESGALGDCLGWTPVVNQYALNKNKKVNFYTPHKHLFDKDEYSMIDFIDYSSKDQIKENETTIKVGCFKKENLSVPLQKLAADILEVDEKSITHKKPLLNKTYFKDRPFEKKYVCIATQSTAQLKYWNNPEGWNKTVDYLKTLGYEVVCVDRYSSYGNEQKMNFIPKNALHYPGKSMADIINCLHHSEFMIGLSSGLSWLAWACEKPVVMICGFLKPEYHFDTPYYVQNTNVCNNCWHDPKHSFDSSNWMWCPENKNFECSSKISFEIVKENIDNLIQDHNL